MDATDITRLWARKRLTPTDIHEYLRKNVIVMDPLLSTAAIRTATDLCMDLYEWAIGKGEPCGLGQAIIENDLDKAMGCCDLHMRHGGLWIVSVFLYNCAPRGWNKKED